MAANNTQYPNSRKSIDQEGRWQNVPGNGLKGTKLGETTNTDDSRTNTTQALYPRS